MVFAVSQGTLRAVQKPSYQAPASVRLSDDLTQDYATLYRKQSSVRTVVDFLARNVAQLSLHTFQRVDDSDRKRVHDHPFAQLMRTPNSYTTGFRLMRDLISDRGIYDRALWVKSTENGQPVLVRIPPRLWTIKDNDSWLSPKTFVIEGNRGKTELAAKHCVYFRGYNPEDERYGLSPIESLRRILSEEFAAGQMREQSLRNGARIGGYIQRPVNAPAWSDAARARFGIGWRGQYQGQTATEGGGTPVLEDGMTFVAAGHSAEDMQYIESRKLSREEVAAAYFIPPPMVGILDHATFGNIEEQHKMLYQDTLGPILQEVQQEIALQLISAEWPDDAGELYVEFNMLEKLRGSFEEQASQLQTSVGAPFLTRNEARARLNLPRIDGADQLVVPLNVLVGGQASPTDAGTQNLRAALGMRTKGRSMRAKDGATDAAVRKTEEVVAAFFARQRDSVLSALGAKAGADWWDADRWDEELASDLFAVALAVTKDVGAEVVQGMGFAPDAYDVARTEAFLREVAKSRAGAINSTTRDQIQAILDGDGPEGVGSPAHVFEQAKESRSTSIAGTLTTTFAAFATVEAAKQNSSSAQKTWLVTSGNPRPEHAAMHGETVGIDDAFSNSAKWPGDPVLGADGVAGCTCDVEVSF